MFTAFMAWLGTAWEKLLPWIVGITAALGGLAYVRKTGEDTVILKDTQNANLEQKQALQIQQNTTAMSDAAVDKLLRSRFSR